MANEETSGRTAASLLGVRFVAYAPGPPFDPSHHPQVPVDREVVKRELTELRTRFDGLVTYGLGLGQDCIPEVAQELGYRAVILGAWDPNSAEEVETAIRLAKQFRGLVAGVCVGNEGLTVHRSYSLDDIQRVIERLRRDAPWVLCTTSEPILPRYLDDAALRACGDFLAPNVHPFWALPEGASMEEAVAWTLRVVGRLAQAAPERVILVKETGWPSGGRPDCTPDRQREFWHQLMMRQEEWPKLTAFVVFEGCDLPWKETAQAPFESHWGLLTANAASRKPALSVFPPLLPQAPAAEAAGEPLTAKTLKLVSPLLYSGETLLAPVQELGTALKFAVEAKGNFVTLRHGGTTVVARAGEPTVKISGATQTLGAPCVLVGGRFYAPLRILEPLLGAAIKPPEGTRPAEVAVGSTDWALPFATSDVLTLAGWQSFEGGRYEDTLLYARTCLQLYLEAASQQNKVKGRFIEWVRGDPEDAKQRIFNYWALNDCGACAYQIVKVCSQQGDKASAQQAAGLIKSDLCWSQVWDPRGWFWKPTLSLEIEYPDLDP